MEIRKITKDERNAVEKLHQYAYGYWSDQEITEDKLEYMDTDETLGVFDKGQLQATMFLLKLQQSVRGILKGMGGISMVGSYPEARRKGYVRDLMHAGYNEMRDHGLSVSMLEPFRESFYLRLGYVPANDRLRLKAPLEALRSPSASELRGKWEFERVVASEGKEDYLEFITRFGPPNYHGYVLRPNFTDIDWKRRNKDTLLVFVRKKGKIEALARYRFKGFMHFQEGGKMTVLEMYWRSIEAQSALFNYLSKHKDQISEIMMILPFGTRYQHWFMDLPKEIEIRSWNPWMVRVIVAEEALKGLPVDAPGEITLKITDPTCKWNNTTLAIKAQDKHLKITRTKKEPNVETTIEGLSALVFGTHTVDALEYSKWIKILNRKAKETLQQWFSVLPFYTAYTF